MSPLSDPSAQPWLRGAGWERGRAPSPPELLLGVVLLGSGDFWGFRPLCILTLWQVDPGLTFLPLLVAVLFRFPCPLEPASCPVLPQPRLCTRSGLWTTAQGWEGRGC